MRKIDAGRMASEQVEKFTRCSQAFLNIRLGIASKHISSFSSAASTVTKWILEFEKQHEPIPSDHLLKSFFILLFQTKSHKR